MLAISCHQFARVCLGVLSGLQLVGAVTYAGSVCSSLVNRSEVVTIAMIPSSFGDDLENNVPYLKTVEEREPFRVIVKDGLLYQSDESGLLNLIDTNQEKEMFVMDESGEIYIDNHQYLPGQKRNHSMFLAGGAVAAAGNIEIKAGRVISVDCSTGHYQIPPGMLSQLRLALTNKGVQTETNQYLTFDRKSEAPLQITEDEMEIISKRNLAASFTKSGLLATFEAQRPSVIGLGFDGVLADSNQAYRLALLTFDVLPIDTVEKYFIESPSRRGRLPLLSALKLNNPPGVSPELKKKWAMIIFLKTKDSEAFDAAINLLSLPLVKVLVTDQEFRSILGVDSLNEVQRERISRELNKHLQ
jgi:hypothetical protein